MPADPIPTAVPVPVPDQPRPEVPELWCAVEWDGAVAISGVETNKQEAMDWLGSEMPSGTSARLFRLPSDQQLAAARAKREEWRKWFKHELEYIAHCDKIPEERFQAMVDRLLTEVLPEEVQA